MLENMSDMNVQVQAYIEQYPAEVVETFKTLRRLIYESTDGDLVETLWARLPSYYAGEAFVRLIPFKDHINIEARAAIKYKDELAGYKITPKGMVQVYVNQDIPEKVIKRIFSETFR